MINMGAMTNIGQIFLRSNNDKEVIFSVDESLLEFTEDPMLFADHEKLKCVNHTQTEVTFRCNNATINRQLLWLIAYGSNPWMWPVSNNWLKLHGYYVRRRVNYGRN